MNEVFTVIVQSNNSLEFLFGPYTWPDAEKLSGLIQEQLATGKFPYPLKNLAGRTVNIRKIVLFPK